MARGEPEPKHHKTQRVSLNATHFVRYLMQRKLLDASTRVNRRINPPMSNHASLKQLSIPVRGAIHLQVKGPVVGGQYLTLLLARQAITPAPLEPTLERLLIAVSHLLKVFRPFDVLTGSDRVAS